MARVDLTVRGGGIFGLSIAWAAARRGARVRLIETQGIGAGASGGLVGALAPHVPEQWNEKKAFQLDSLLMAAAWWHQVMAASGLPTGYAATGRLQPLADQAAVDLARQREVSARDLWQGRAVWRVVASTGAAWEPATPTGLLVHDTLSARLHPRLALAALAAALRARGGEVVIGEGREEGPVIWATGVDGLAALSQDRGQALGGGVKGQAVSLRHRAPDAPQILVEGMHIVPHQDGSVAIGSTSENHWQDATSTDGQLETLLARARAALPVLADAPVVARWAGLRPRAKSRAPLLGPWPGRPGHFVANGGFKIGFGMAPKAAEVMADLVLDGQDRIPAGFRN
jgi:glycine oxidase